MRREDKSDMTNYIAKNEKDVKPDQTRFKVSPQGIRDSDLIN